MNARRMIAAIGLAALGGVAVWAGVEFFSHPYNYAERPQRTAAEEARHSLWMLADAIPGETVGDIIYAEAGTDPNPKVQAFCSKISDQDVAVFMPENLPQKDAAQFRLTCRALGYL